MEKQIKNVNDLREDLIEMYNNLKEGNIGLRDAKERNNTAGKIMSTAKLQMEYNAYTKSDARIPFLEVQ